MLFEVEFECSRNHYFSLEHLQTVQEDTLMSESWTQTMQCEMKIDFQK